MKLSATRTRRLSCVGLVTMAMAALIAPAASAVTPPQNQYFIIHNINSGKCLEVGGWATNNGAGVDQWDCTGGANQQWFWDGKSIRNRNSGKCLEVGGWATNNGAGVDQWDCTGGANQQWDQEVLESGNGSCASIFWNVNSQLVLEVFGWSTANGARVDQWQLPAGVSFVCEAGDSNFGSKNYNQQWS